MNIITVIGNGFDLQLGLKTRYTDFFKWLFEDKLKSTKDNYVEIKEPENFKDIRADIKIERFPEKQKIHYNIIKSPNLSGSIPKITDWWSLYFLEKKNTLPDSNWCSVEEEIEKVLTNLQKNRYFLGMGRKHII
jgi:hypothetical protein